MVEGQSVAKWRMIVYYSEHKDVNFDQKINGNEVIVPILPSQTIQATVITLLGIDHREYERDTDVMFMWDRLTHPFGHNSIWSQDISDQLATDANYTLDGQTTCLSNGSH